MKPLTSLTLVVLLAAACPTASAQSGPPQEWRYRRAVTVFNTGSQLINYQVRIDLNPSTFDFSKAKADGSDVRITTQGDKPVPFWIERWAGSGARIWARIPSAPTGQITLNMYYGNPAASGASNGSATFEFFDDFTRTSWTQGYFRLSESQVALVRDQAFETTAPHTMSVVEANRGGYKYWGYYGPSYWAAENGRTDVDESGWVGLARSNDLVNWVKNPNPLFRGGRERWPSVLLVDGVFYMAHTTNFGNPSSIVLRTSTDGINFGSPTPLVSGASNNQNPALFQDPKDGQFYLYWYQSSSEWEIRAKKASTVAGLASASSVSVIGPRSITIAAPQVMYYRGTYYLAVETDEGRVWQTRVFASKTPTGGFRELPGNPVLADGSACFFQHIFDNTLHAYYCKQTPASNEAGLNWTVEHRTADLSAGPASLPSADPARWTPSGGFWQSVSAQRDGSSFGDVLQGSTTEKQILASSFTGTDYIAEVSGRLIGGRVWGLGVRAADAANLYTVNIYPSQSPNLYLYRWNQGQPTAQLATATIGQTQPGLWQKLIIKVYFSTIEVSVNGQAPLLRINDSTFSYGAIALYGEGGTSAQFSNVFVRKYAASEPAVSIGPELGL